MSSASSIIAGNAFVRFGVDDKAMGPGLGAVEAKLRAFGGTAGELTGRIGDTFGKKMIAGITAAFAINAADRALRGLADQMREASVNGESLGFFDVGVAIGESIADGLKSIWIAGPIGDILAQTAGAWIWGVDMSAEAKIAQQQKVSAARNATMGRIDDATGSLKEGLLSSDGPNPTKRLAEEQIRQLNAFQKELMETGLSSADASHRLDDLRTAMKATLGQDAMGRFSDAILKFNERWMTEGGKAEQEINSIADAVANMMRSAGFGSSYADLSANQIRDTAHFSNSQAIINDLQRSLDQQTMTPDELLRRRLVGLHATSAQIDEALAIQAQLGIGSGGGGTINGSFSSRIFNSVGSSGALGVDWQQQIARNTKATADALKNGTGGVFAP